MTIFFPGIQLSKSVSNFKMQIFNRWGLLVFESRVADGQGWDGRFNGQEQPMGVYVYVVYTTYINGHEEQYTGHVALIR